MTEEVQERETSTARFPTGPGRREQLGEVGVFLLLIVPSMILSYFVIHQGALTFDLTAWATMLRDLGLVLLIFYFLWRNGEPRSAVGWSAGKRTAVEGLLGVVLYLALATSSGILDEWLRKLGLSNSSTPVPQFLNAKGWQEYVLATALVVVVAVAEETIFRGYLILRLKAVTGSTAAAVILSTVIFALGHGYEGTLGVITVGFMGLVFALVYVWRKRLEAPIVMHFLQDFIGIVVAPILAHHR